jgi:hypothetical protein
MSRVWSPQAELVAISKADGLQRKLMVHPPYSQAILSLSFRAWRRIPEAYPMQHLVDLILEHTLRLCPSAKLMKSKEWLR